MVKKQYSKKAGKVIIRQSLYKFYLKYGGGSYVNGNKRRTNC